MNRLEIAALTDEQLDAFIVSMGDTKNILLERAHAERKAREYRAS